MTPWGRARGCVAPMGQNPFCTNIIMLPIKSKVMKRRIQWCKTFAPGGGGGCLGVTRDQKVGFWVPFIFIFILIVTQLLVGFI